MTKMMDRELALEDYYFSEKKLKREKHSLLRNRSKLSKGVGKSLLVIRCKHYFMKI